MKIKVINCRKENEKWILTVDYWDNCYCNKKQTVLTFDRLIKPGRKDVLKELSKI